MTDRPESRAAPGAVQLLQLGGTVGVIIGAGVFAGYLLDRLFGTAPLLVFLGLGIGILGAATGSYYLIRPYVADASGGASKPKE